MENQRIRYIPDYEPGKRYSSDELERLRVAIARHGLVAVGGVLPSSAHEQDEGFVRGELGRIMQRWDGATMVGPYVLETSDHSHAYYPIGQMVYTKHSE